jgi:alpha-D-xyloside xylohydrolase
MKKDIVLLAAMAFFGMTAHAQSYQKTAGGLKISTPQGINEVITFYSPTVVRIAKYQSNAMPAKKSYPVILTPQKTDITYSDGADNVTMTSSAMAVDVDTRTGNVSFKNPQGEKLVAEKENTTSFSPFDDAGRKTFSVGQTFVLDREEAIFGLGQRQSGVMNHRGQHVYLQNGNTNICIPYFTSVKGYGLYWDNPSATNFDDDRSGLSFKSVTGDMVDYYFMYKDGTQDGVMSCLRSLTGKATLFPIWSLGYWQCRERYSSSDELCDVLDKYREQKVPIDGIVQDWQYWGCDSNWNAMRFMNPHYINKMGDPHWMKYLPNGENKNAPNLEARIKTPEEMVNYVHSHNAHIMISIWPSFGPWTDQYKELKAIGALYKFDTWPANSDVHDYDAFNPKARDIYWKHLKPMYKMGFDGWWTDSTEPDHLDAKPADFDIATADGTWRSVQNAYPLVTNRGIYEAQRAMKDNTKRLFLMTRSSFLGMQHYGSFSWSGDIVSSWETFKNQVPASLNYMLCGIPMWSDDLGGFFGWDYRNDPTNPAFQELQVRWMEWGCFMPLMRNHCSGPLKNEIYRWGKPGEWPYDCQKKYIELRYRLLPYLYSQLGNCFLNDETMMRPFVMDFKNDKRAINLDNEYMLGHSLLIRPVTENLYTWKDDKNQGHPYYADIAKASNSVRVYLPDGSQWYDFWTNTLLDGGTEQMKACPINIMPVYVKAGSIVPFGPAVQYAAEKKWDNLELRIYPGADADYMLYEDEGDTYNYEKGAYSTIAFHWDNKEQTLTIGQRKGSFKGMLKDRKFRILVVGANTAGGDTEPQEGCKDIVYKGQQTVTKM